MKWQRRGHKRTCTYRSKEGITSLNGTASVQVFSNGQVFFFTMDLITGRKETLAKAKLLEIMAGIPYRAWENRQYARMTQRYQNKDLVQQARRIMTWGREAQDK